MKRREFIACGGLAGVACLELFQAPAMPQAFARDVANPLPLSFSGLQNELARIKPDVGRFRREGPFKVDVHENYALPVSTQRTDADLAFSSFPDMQPRQPSSQLLAKDQIDSDLIFARHAERVPLIIFMHGFGGSTINHLEQARHVASWGMHAITLRLFNDSEWGTNGRTVARLVRFLMSPPRDLEPRIDPAKIILVGYSFGAISASMALALKAPAKGAVLLDPAAVRTAISTWLPLVEEPVMIIGADENYVQANLRDHYFQHLGGNVVEVSVKGATHEDAQSMEDVETTRERQTTFNSIITAAAFSLAGGGALEYVWASIKSELDGGRLFGARRK